MGRGRGTGTGREGKEGLKRGREGGDKRRRIGKSKCSQIFKRGNGVGG